MAEIGINLKLLTGQIRQQSSQAGQEIRQGVSAAQARWNAWNATRPRGASPSEWIAAQKAGGSTGGGIAGAFAGGIAGGVVGAIINQLSSIVARIVGAIKSAIVDAFRSAAALYAKQLTTGLPGGFVGHRSMLAQTIGVGEHEVYRFGQAVAYLNEKLKLSSAEINRNVRTLTATAWSWRILGANFKALWSQVATAMSPAVKEIADFLSAEVELIRETGSLQIAVKGLTVLFQLLNRLIGFQIILGQSLVNFYRTMVDAFKWVRGKENPFKDSQAGWTAIGKMFEALSRSSATAKVPAATADYKRLEASPWERMGLIIGQGASSHPLRATERNTRKTAEGVMRLVNAISGKSNPVPKLAPTAVNGA